MLSEQGFAETCLWALHLGTWLAWHFIIHRHVSPEPPSASSQLSPLLEGSALAQCAQPVAMVPSGEGSPESGSLSTHPLPACVGESL